MSCFRTAKKYIYIRCKSAYYKKAVRRECVIPQVYMAGRQCVLPNIRWKSVYYKMVVRIECVLQKKAYRRYASSRISSILRYTDSILRTLKMP